MSPYTKRQQQRGWNREIELPKRKRGTSQLMCCSLSFSIRIGSVLSLFFYSSAFHLICMQNTCCITFLLMYMTKLHKCDESEYVDCIHAYSKTFHYDTQEEGGQPNTGLPQSYLYLYLLLLCFHAFVLYFHVLFSLYSISWAITAFWFDCCASPPRARFIRLALVFVFITRLTIYVTVCCSNSSVKSSATVFCCVLAGGRADDKK